MIDVKDAPRQPGDRERIRAALCGHLVTMDLLLEYARMRQLIARPAFDRLVDAGRKLRAELAVNGETATAKGGRDAK